MKYPAILLCLLLAACVAPPVVPVVHGPGYAPPYPLLETVAHGPVVAGLERD